MNHKRKRPKNARAGCLMCKRHKANGTPLKERLLPHQLRHLLKWKDAVDAGDARDP